jgi:hypothetical protein
LVPEERQISLRCTGRWIAHENPRVYSSATRRFAYFPASICKALKSGSATFPMTPNENPLTSRYLQRAYSTTVSDRRRISNVQRTPTTSRSRSARRSSLEAAAYTEVDWRSGKRRRPAERSSPNGCALKVVQTRHLSDRQKSPP